MVALHCEEGGAVSEGDPLVTLEAMKMETVVRSPCSGKVQEVFVDLGDAVVSQQLVVVLDG